jgi:hypothetical protein
VPTYDATEAFRRAFAKLDPRACVAFMAAVPPLSGEPPERRVAPWFHPSLRVRKLTELELWWPGFGDGMRAVFRIAPPVVDGEVHVVWVFIGDHDAYERFRREHG